MAQIIQNPAYLISALILAILPSLVWLFFYLKEDEHPEPRRWLFIIFLAGIALAPLVIFLEMALAKFFGYLNLAKTTETLTLLIFIAPLIEEVAKYGIVHLALNKNPVLDEPVDGMIYIIVAALGFAAIENVFAIFSYVPAGASGYLSATLNFMSIRFISAVALHGLASSVAGYFFALYYFIKRDVALIFWGLLAATIFHSLYNFFISQSNTGFSQIFFTGIVLGGAAVLVIYLFNRLKHYKTYQQAVLDDTAENKI